MRADARLPHAPRCTIQADRWHLASRCRILAVTALSQALGGDWTHTKSCKNCFSSFKCGCVCDFMAYFTSISSFYPLFGRICLRFARLVTSWRRAEPDDANNASISPTLEMPMLQTWLHLDTRCSEMQAHTPASRCGCTGLRPHSRLHLDAHLHCVYSGVSRLLRPRRRVWWRGGSRSSSFGTGSTTMTPLFRAHLREGHWRRRGCRLWWSLLAHGHVGGVRCVGQPPCCWICGPNRVVCEKASSSTSASYLRPVHPGGRVACSRTSM
jgi:hypothetical protein